PLFTFPGGGERQRVGSLEHVVSLRAEGPGAAGDAAFRCYQQIVEVDEVACEGVMVGCQGLWEQGQAWVAVPLSQIPEDLIVSPVFLQDVNDMFDVRLEEGEGLLVRRGLVGSVEAVVMGNLARQTR